jgi:hypothetical protein
MKTAVIYDFKLPYLQIGFFWKAKHINRNNIAKDIPIPLSSTSQDASLIAMHPVLFAYINSITRR